MCLGQGALLHMAQLMPLPLTISCSSKSGLVLPCWFWVACWRSGYGVGFMIERLWVRSPAAPLSGNNSGQVVHTHVPLSPSSITSYRCKSRGGNVVDYQVVEEVWSTIHNWVQANCQLKTCKTEMSTVPCCRILLLYWPGVICLFAFCWLNYLSGAGSPG